MPRLRGRLLRLVEDNAAFRGPVSIFGLLGGKGSNNALLCDRAEVGIQEILLLIEKARDKERSRGRSERV